MRIGFTGTQKGMTVHQMQEVERILLELQNSTSSIHHGGCVGADSEFHSIVFKLGEVKLIPIVHPASGVSSSKIAKLNPPDATYLSAKPALVRNHDIVDAVDVLIATPKEKHEVLRSGTWATIRYARKQGKIIRLTVP